jgi:hypothetical protein
MGATRAGLAAYLLRREASIDENDEDKRDVPPERIISTLSKILDLTAPP